MLTIAIRLAAILAQLRQAIAAYAVQQSRGPSVVWLGTVAYAPRVPPNQPQPLPDAVWALLSNRLGRMATRFTALFARWRSGTLPATLRAPRPSRAGTPSPVPRLPAARGWVNARITAAAPCAGMIHALLAAPELPQFLAAAPQAGRLLRPLCHALGLAVPPWLQRPPRPKRVGARPAQPKTPARRAAPSAEDRPLPRHIRAAARAWKKSAA